MKKVMLSFLVSAIALMSCSKDETGTSNKASQQITVSATPSAITTYVSENYPDASISTVFKNASSDTLYAVTLNTWEFLAFDHNGALIGGSMAGALCDSTNGHHDDGHHGGGHHGGGPHGGCNPGGEPHGGGPHGGGIPVDSIPSAITDYIAANFPGYAVHNAMYDSLCQFGKTLDVMIDSSNSVHRKLIFDASGLFLARASRVNSSDLPAAVSSALTLTYSTYTLRGKAEMFILSDNSKEYRVFLHLNQIRLSVILKEDGTIVCEQ